MWYTFSDKFLDMLELCKTRKKTSKTRANDRSSRSHTLIQFSIISCPREIEPSQDPKLLMRASKINFIDLSGAERGVTLEAHQKTVEEGNQINKSLFALSKCINTLASQKKGVYIPYRESKLTRLLKDSLGGMTKTTMICHISPCFAKFKESVATLKYAELAKLIPVANQENLKQYQALHGDLRQKMADDIRKEINKWKSKQAVQKTANISQHNAEDQIDEVNPEDSPKARQLIERLRVVCEDQMDIRRNLCDVEAQNKMNEVLASKERDFLKTGQDLAGLEDMFAELRQSTSQNEYIKNHLLKQLEESKEETDKLMRQIYNELGPKAGKEVYNRLMSQKEEQLRKLEMETNLKLYEEMNSLLLDKVVGMNNKINTYTRQHTSNSQTLEDTFRSAGLKTIPGGKAGTGEILISDRDHQGVNLNKTHLTSNSKYDRTITEENDEGSENLAKSNMQNNPSTLKGNDIDNSKRRPLHEFEFETFIGYTKTLDSENDDKICHGAENHSLEATVKDKRVGDNVIEINENVIKLNKKEKKMTRPEISGLLEESPNMQNTTQKFNEVMNSDIGTSKLVNNSNHQDIGKTSLFLNSQNIDPKNQKNDRDLHIKNPPNNTSIDSQFRQTNFKPILQSEDSRVESREGNRFTLPGHSQFTEATSPKYNHHTPVDLPSFLADIRHDAGSILISKNMQDEFLSTIAIDSYTNPDRMTTIKFGMEDDQAVRWNLNVGWGEEYKIYKGLESPGYPETGCIMEGEFMFGEKDFLALLDPQEAKVFAELSNKNKVMRNPLKKKTKGEKGDIGLPQLKTLRSVSRERSSDSVRSKKENEEPLPSISNKAGRIIGTDIKTSEDQRKNLKDKLPAMQAGTGDTFTNAEKYADSSARGKTPLLKQNETDK